MNSVKLLKRNNSHTLQWKGNSLKALTIATLASLVIFGFNTAQAEENFAAAEIISSLPSGENTDVSKLVYSTDVSEGLDNYLSLRVNPSPENLTFTNAQVDFQPSPVGRGGIVTGFAAELPTPTLDKLHAEDPTTYPNSSKYTYSDGTSSNYDIKVTNESQTIYKNIVPKLNEIDSEHIVFVNQTSNPSGYSWLNSYVAGSDIAFSGNTISGAIRSHTAHNDVIPSSGSWNKWYTYTYTKPSDFSIINTGTTNASGSSSGSDSVHTVIGSSNVNVVNNPSGSTIATDNPKITNKTYANNILVAPFNSYTVIGGAAIMNQGTIGDVVADFIGNKTTPSSSGSYTYALGTVANVQTKGQTTRMDSIKGNFIGNVTYASADSFGAVSNLANRGTVSIGKIEGNFVGNSALTTYQYATVYGSAISNLAKSGAIIIDAIEANFIGNSSVAANNEAYGGAISNRTNSGSITIGYIYGDFIGNSASSANTSYGGAMHIYASAGGSQINIGRIISDFIGNTANCGGAIANRVYVSSTIKSSTIGPIEGNFVGNYAYVSSGTAYGGAIFNGYLSSNTPSYHENAVIKLDNTTFSGNYTKSGTTISPNSIYNAGKIYIQDNATVTVNDGWKSHNDAYLLMNENSTLNLNIANGSLQDDSLGKLTKNGTINATVDINWGTQKADTISTSSVTISDGNNKVYLNGLNFLDNLSSASGSKKVKILNTQSSGLQLELADALKTEIALQSTPTGNNILSYDDIDATTNWNKIYNEYTAPELASVFGTLTVGTTSTTNDSVTINITRSGVSYGDKTIVDSMGDTLKLVVADTTNASKEFNAAAEGDSYTVGDNLGTLAGTLTINGVAGGNLETVNLNGKNGITIAGANTLNLNNVKLTDTSTGKTAANTTIATVTNNGANVNLNNTELNGNIVSESGYNLSVKGVSKLNGTVGKATVTTDSTTNLKLATNTFTNADVTTTAGKIDLSNGNATEVYNFNKLVSDAATKYVIDFDVTNSKADQIKTATASSGKVTIDNLNITGNISDLPGDMTGNVFIVKILDTQDNNLQLDLSDYVKSQLGTSNYEIGRTTLNKDDAVVANNTWTTQYDHKTQDEVSYGRLGLATTTTTNDSIGVTFDHKASESVVNHGKRGDTLALVNQSDIDGRNFTTTDETATYVVGGNLGATGAGEFTVQGATDGENTSKIDFNGKSGFELSNAGTTLNIKDVEITGANVLLSATAGDSVVNLDNVTLDGTNGGITSNGTVNVKGSSSVDDSIAITDGTFNVSDNSVLGGNITLGGATTAAIKDNSKVSGDITLSGTSSATLSDNASVSGDITLNDTTKLTVTGDKVDVTGKITGDSTAELNVKDGTFEVKNTVSGVNTVLDNGQLKLTDESLFTAGLTVNTPSSISMQNDKIGALNFNSLTLNDVLTMQIDADLALKTIDTIDAGTVTIGGGSIKVDKINILHPTTEQELSLLFTNNADLANIVSYTGDNEIVYSPIFKYTTTYEKKDDGGYFKFVLPSKSGGGASGNSTPAASDFNPAVLSTPVAAQGIAQVGMNHVFSQSFEHADGFMPLPMNERMSMLRGNVYAINDVSTTEQVLKNTGVSTDFNDNMDLNKFTDIDHTNKAIWVKPYTSFERINLHNGPKVDMISYGTLVGGDSDFRKLKNGWANVGTLYLGYNGASIDYSGVDTTFNGGVLGITESFYKKNFFTAISANVGAGFAEAQTMYGHDDMTMLMAGVASKTGYNFEFKEGKFIIQPSLLLSYSMINTFDYTNSAGVRIDSDPLHTIQLNPNVKFIANLKHEWQPYISVGMVYNLMNETKVTANNVKLPETSTRPYVEYGIGVQKHFGETFSGYGQAMVRNGGRNGIALTAGFRWALGGKKAKKDNKNVNNNVLKDASAMPQHDVSSKVRRSDAPQEVVNTNGAYKDDTLQSKAVVKSVKENSKARNLARYQDLLGE